MAPLTGKYCDQWLNTEYNTAVIRAHRAADWKHFETEIDVYPNLRWAQTTSAVPDKVHQFFWSQKLTLPVNDTFWQRHHPGERWGCKCTCEQTDEPVNDLGGLAAKYEDTASKGLHGNPAQTGQLFSEDHPYYPKNCGNCPFTKEAKNRMRLFLNKNKDCASCQACKQAIQSSVENTEVRQEMMQLIENCNNNRPNGSSVQLGILPSQYIKKIEEKLGTEIVSANLFVNDKQIAHALRTVKQLRSAAVEKSEFIEELLNIGKLEIGLLYENNRPSIHFICRHGSYFNKYVFRINEYDKKSKTTNIALITAGKIDSVILDQYEIIK